jgi:hypothetical protein
MKVGVSTVRVDGNRKTGKKIEKKNRVKIDKPKTKKEKK